MRRWPETVGAAFVCLAHLPDPGRWRWRSGAMADLSVHSSEPIGSQTAGIGLSGTGFQRFTSAGAVAHQLHS
jgi:hypothetical protein